MYLAGSRQMKTNKTVPLNILGKQEYSPFIGYPRITEEEQQNRLAELKKLGVEAVEFRGEKSITDIPVLGKGCVGIVIVAHTKAGKAALKIRRTDADRNEMFHEAEMLTKANTVNVGPKLFKTSKNFLLMQLVEGQHFPRWLENTESKDRHHIVSVIGDVLDQCYRLDEAGLDHGELSTAPKHIIVDQEDRAYLIDFETASTERRTANVTSMCQYLFMGSHIAHIIEEELGKQNKKQLIKTLRKYKHEKTRENFQKVLKTIFCQKPDGQ
jgi:putative serine/threonine protein kinase